MKFLSGGENKIHNPSQSIKMFPPVSFLQGNGKATKYIEDAGIFATTAETSLLLPATDLECALFFITSSIHKQWASLNVSHCSIQDCGLYIMHRYLNHSDETITK